MPRVLRGKGLRDMVQKTAHVNGKTKRYCCQSPGVLEEQTISRHLRSKMRQHTTLLFFVRDFHGLSVETVHAGGTTYGPNVDSTFYVALPVLLRT